jgi:hypothetical protein
MTMVVDDIFCKYGPRLASDETPEQADESQADINTAEQPSSRTRKIDIRGLGKIDGLFIVSIFKQIKFDENSIFFQTKD